jgi:hypothetical protein
MSGPATYLDDPNFSLRFVKKKSRERVLELVEEIKASFCQPAVAMDPAPAACLARVEDHPELLLTCPHVLELCPDADPPPNVAPRLAALKPFLFPFYPATAPRAADPESERTRSDFLSQSRLQHQRLLWAFQDRLIRDLCAADEQFQLEPFETATAQIAREQSLPVKYVEKKQGTLQNRYNALLKKSQKKAAAVLEAQRREAKLIREAKLFELNCPKMQKNEPIVGTENQFELPVVCPFSFLTDSS